MTDCRLGRVEYDGARYCFEHGGFNHAGHTQYPATCESLEGDDG